jgi:phosphohistidine swiveling domain-containing protein
MAGIRTTQVLTRAAREEMGETNPSMEEALPDAFNQLKAFIDSLETHYRDMQDVEFTIEQGRLFILDSRNGNRTPKAALKIAVALANKGLITSQEAVMRMNPAAIQQLLQPDIDPGFLLDVIATGHPASPGAASGQICLNSSEVEALAAHGKPVILVVNEITPVDHHGVLAARGIVTAFGGMTSHAAVVARGMGRPCVTGAGKIRCNPRDQTLDVGDRTFRVGDPITVDGSRGHVLNGAAPLIGPRISGEMASLTAWADQIAGEIGSVVEDTEGARRLAAFGGRKIVVSAIECLSRNPGGPRTLLESIAANDTGAVRQALDAISRLIRNSIVDIVLASETKDICVIIGETFPHEQRVDIPGAALYGRGSVALWPEFVFMQLAAVHDAINQLEGTQCTPQFTVAIANVFHESDIAVIRKWWNERAQRRDHLSIPQVAMAGVLDSPHSVLFHERIFQNVDKLIIDLRALARTLFLLPKEAVETYQDLGNLELGFEIGGAFDDVIRLLDRSFRSTFDASRSIEICVLLTGPCQRDTMQVLLACGVTKVAVPAALLPGAIISIAHSFAPA